jgi:hypothetical protein
MPIYLDIKNFADTPSSKWIEIGGSTQPADQHEKEGWRCHGLLCRYLSIVKSLPIIYSIFVNTKYL